MDLEPWIFIKMYLTEGLEIWKGEWTGLHSTRGKTKSRQWHVWSIYIWKNWVFQNFLSKLIQQNTGLWKFPSTGNPLKHNAYDNNFASEKIPENGRKNFLSRIQMTIYSKCKLLWLKIFKLEEKTPAEAKLKANNTRRRTFSRTNLSVLPKTWYPNFSKSHARSRSTHLENWVIESNNH